MIKFANDYVRQWGVVACHMLYLLDQVHAGVAPFDGQALLDAFFKKGTLFTFKVQQKKSQRESIYLYCESQNGRRAFQHPMVGLIWSVDLTLSITGLNNQILHKELCSLESKAMRAWR